MVPAGGGGASPPAGPCGAEVALRLGAAPGQASSGLLALAVLLGLGLGGGAAALLWLGALGPRLLLRHRHRQKDDSQRLIESNNSAAQKHEDYFLPERKEAETLAVTEKDDQPSWNTNLTEFALKAKVIYPINQRFRPLADGSSNPSLHDTAKQRAMLPHQTLGGSTSSSTGSLSQGAKDDCTSSTTIHSAASDDRYQDQTFLKVTCFPELLTCDVFDVKMCLYSLFLKHLQLIDVELRRQKHVMILHVFRVYIVDFYFKKKMPEDLYQSILHTQETAFEELQAQLNSRLLSMEFSGAHKAEYQTLDDLERSDKGYADHVLDHMEAFWKQTDQSLLLLLDQAKCSRAKAKKIRMCLGEAMIAVEEFFGESQDSQVMATQERMFNWEQLVKTVALLKTQIQEESKCRFHAISHTLDELLRRNNLTVKQKEELLTGIQEAFAGKIELYEEECIQLGKNLIQKCLMSHTEKIERLSKAQEDQEGNLLHKSQPLGDLKAFLKKSVKLHGINMRITAVQRPGLPPIKKHLVDLASAETNSTHSFQLEELQFLDGVFADIKAYCEMSEQQRKTRWKLEKESDCETIEAMIDLYKKLHSRYSHCLEDLVVQLFLQTLPVLTSLPLQECEFLKDEQQEDLALQLEKSESHQGKLWMFFQEQMQQEQKLWMEEHAFSAVTHKCLSETNEKILLCVMSRLGGLSKASSNYVTQKHKSLLQSMLRRLLLRQIALSVFAQMRTSRRRSSVGELKEHHILQQSSSHCFDELQWKQLKETELHIAEEEEKLGNEMQQTRLEFHQQLTAETQESLQFLQQHMQQVIGQALVQQARQLAEKHDTDGEEDLKQVLKEATWENVHLSSHRAQRLLQNYLEQLTKIHESHEDAAQKALQERTECHKHPKKWDCEQKDQPDLPNTSPASRTRTLWKPKRVQAWFDVQQKNRLAALKQKVLSLSTLEMQLENQLMRAEHQFVAELSAAIRLPLPLHRRPLESAAELGKKLQPKRLGAQSQEREEEEEEEMGHKAKDSGSRAHQVSEAFRSKWQSHQEDEVSQVNNPKKLLEKRSKNIS